MSGVTFTIPIATVNPLNRREHHCPRCDPGRQRALEVMSENTDIAEPFGVGPVCSCACGSQQHWDESCWCES